MGHVDGHFGAGTGRPQTNHQVSTQMGTCNQPSTTLCPQQTTERKLQKGTSLFGILSVESMPGLLPGMQPCVIWMFMTCSEVIGGHNTSVGPIMLFWCSSGRTTAVAVLPTGYLFTAFVQNNRMSRCNCSLNKSQTRLYENAAADPYHYFSVLLMFA